MVISCFALHNFCVRNGVPLPDEVNNQEQGPNLPERHENGAANDNRNGNMEPNRIAILHKYSSAIHIMYCSSISDWKLALALVLGCGLLFLLLTILLCRACGSQGQYRRQSEKLYHIKIKSS